MAGGQDRYPRFIPVVAEPLGKIHYEEKPIRVVATVRMRRPECSYEVRGYAVAWTITAVQVLWYNKPGSRGAGGYRLLTCGDTTMPVLA